MLGDYSLGLSFGHLAEVIDSIKLYEVLLWHLSSSFLFLVLNLLKLLFIAVMGVVFEGTSTSVTEVMPTTTAHTVTALGS